MSAKPAPPPDPGVPGYTLGRELGRGGMGVVYAATHLATGIEVAIKTVRPGGAEARAALQTEILAMARLNHPNLLYLYDHGTSHAEDEPLVWLAVELASGGSLEAWEPTSWASVEPVLDAVLSGLAHAHARGVAHRDLKPANLLRATHRDHRPGLKIADFGFTAVRDLDAEIVYGGTPRYLPPEQADTQAGDPGPWSDLYALGAVLWHWVCGTPLYRGRSVKRIVRQHLRSPLPAFAPRFDVPATLQPLLRHMLAKAPGARPRSVAEVRRALGTGHRSTGWALEAAASGSASARLPGIGVGLLPLRDWRMVGRDRARRQLVEALEAVCAEGRPAVRLICGPAGVGKTRLMRWLAETAAEAGLASVLWAPEDIGTALATAMRGPVIVCFDDLDAEAEQSAASLAFARAPILTLATTRTPEAWPDLALVQSFGAVALGPMEPAAFRQLLHSEVGLSGPSTLRLGPLCGELPGVAAAWVAELARTGALQPSPEGFVVDADALGAPPRLDEGDVRALQAALQDASARDVKALRAAALLEREVDGEEWLGLLQWLRLPLPHDALHALASAGVITRREDGFTWTSSAIQDAVLQPPGQPAEHLAAARVLAALPPNSSRRARRGEHLLRAGRVADARAVLLVHQAAAEPAAQERLRDTLELLRPHMGDATDTQKCCFLLMELRVLLNLVSGPAAIPAADALLAAVGTPREPGTLADVDEALRLEAREFVARVYAFEGLPDKALPLLDTLPETPVTLRCRALVQSDLGDYRASEALSRRALALATTPGQQARIANGLGSTLGRAGAFAQALEWFRRSLELLEPEQRYVPHGNIAMTLLVLGRAPEALEHARAAYGLAQHRGARRLAVGAILYGISAALADEEELERIGDQALYSLKRYGLADAHLLLRAIGAAKPERAATSVFLEAVRYAIAHPS